MQRTNRNSERGQAVVIIVVAMVVLLGFTALAVDGSMVYSDRRHAQSAADSSSLAGGTRLAQEMEANDITNASLYGASANCTNISHMNSITSASRQAAKQRAGDNDFVTFNANMNSAQLAERNSGAITSCGKEPITGLLANGSETVLFEQYYVDVQTQITDQTETAFAHFVYGGKMENTVEATTRVFPRQPLAYGYAIVALNDSISNCNSNKGGMQFGGNGTVNVLDGGVFSNGCMDVDGNSTDINLVSSEYSGKKQLSAYYFGTGNHNTLNKIDFGTGDHDDFITTGAFTPITASPQQLADIASNRIPLSTYDIPMPDCSGHEVKSDWVVNYWANHGTHIPSGLYCVTDELKINGNDTVKADKVTFVLLNGMTLNGNSKVEMGARYPTDPDTGNGSIGGVLFYQPRNIAAPIIVNGNSSSPTVGMILRGSWIAPGASLTFDGNSKYKIFGQVVGFNVEFRGSSELLVEYRQNKIASRPARLELHK